VLLSLLLRTTTVRTVNMVLILLAHTSPTSYTLRLLVEIPFVPDIAAVEAAAELVPVPRNPSFSVAQPGERIMSFIKAAWGSFSASTIKSSDTPVTVVSSWAMLT